MDQLVWLSFCISIGFSLLGNFSTGLPFGDGNNNNVKITRRSLELTQTINIQRQEFMQRQCELLGDHTQTLEDLSELQMDHMIVDKEHKLLYCYVPKVWLNQLKGEYIQMLALRIRVRDRGMWLSFV